jgi:hypothetical protein
VVRRKRTQGRSEGGLGGGGREGKEDGLVVLILMERRKEIGHLACSCSQPVPQSVSQSVSQSVDQRSVGRFGECKEKRSE